MQRDEVMQQTLRIGLYRISKAAAFIKILSGCYSLLIQQFFYDSFERFGLFKPLFRDK